MEKDNIMIKKLTQKQAEELTKQITPSILDILEVMYEAESNKLTLEITTKNQNNYKILIQKIKKKKAIV